MNKRGAWIGGIALLALLAALIAPRTPETTALTEFDVRTRCDAAIKERLVSPASVQRVAQSDVERIGNRWRWTVEIDSQNALGALVRSKWGCSVHQNTGLVTD